LLLEARQPLAKSIQLPPERADGKAQDGATRRTHRSADYRADEPENKGPH
jgi:hypothetical protein